MDADTRTALEESIAKWKENLQKAEAGQYTTLRFAAKDCPLCDLFFRTGLEDDCGRCPIRLRTGCSYCDATPYRNVVREIGRCRREEITPPLARLIAAVREEVEFLESLRPAEEL